MVATALSNPWSNCGTETTPGTADGTAGRVVRTRGDGDRESRTRPVDKPSGKTGMTVHQSKNGRVETIEITSSVLRGLPIQSDRAFLRNEYSESQEPALELPLPAVEADGHQTVRILYVDDSPDITELTATFLEKLNDDFEVMTETSVVAALDRIGERKFDCIISDYQMPNTDGLEFLEIVRERFSDIPFILYTGRGSEEIASEAIVAGVTDYVQKKPGTDQYEILANRVENAVDQYRTRRQLWDALSWYRRLVEQGITGVFIVQCEEMVYVNEKLAEIFGYPRSELVGESPKMLVAEEGWPAVDEFIDEVDDAEEVSQYYLTGKRQDGEKISIELHGGSVEYEGEPACIGILRETSGCEARE